MFIVPRKLYCFPADLKSLPPGDQHGEVWVRPLGQSAGGVATVPWTVSWSLNVCGALGNFLQGSRLVHDYALYIKYLFSCSEICTPRLVSGYLCMVHGAPW